MMFFVQTLYSMSKDENIQVYRIPFERYYLVTS